MPTLSRTECLDKVERFPPRGSIMVDIHSAALQAAERYEHPGDYVVGANSAAFLRVANAMLDQGLI
ncbi:MAG: hypothetical protein KF742_00225 [Cryobacterium sp.]|nr:hypothetical protein [Cryobacterium sp.]MBX3090458.1 hypothetical protein [Cryobacterium sp.]MCO5293806.1 hypothetical protein [Homoserinimonas sp.]